MKIALVSQNVLPGLLIFRKPLIQHLVAQGHQVYAFAMDFTQESESSVRAMGAIPVKYKLNKTGLNIIEDIKNSELLSQQFKKIQPHVVLSFFIKPSIWGTLAAKRARVPKIIAMLEGLGYIYTPSPTGRNVKKTILQTIHGLLCRIAYRFANEVWFLNQNDLEDIQKKARLNKTKLRMIGPIGLNLADYPFKPTQSTPHLRFIFVARLLAEKGIFEYLEAAEQIKKQHPDVEFIVLGSLDPDNPASLTQQQLEQVCQRKIITYPGYVTDVAQWIAQSHVFVLPSYYREGVPRSIQEAMAIGRPIITTDVPGCRDTVLDGQTGFLVPPWDVQALIEKMQYFIEQPDQVAKMGNDAHLFAQQKFDADKINATLTRILTGDSPV